MSRVLYQAELLRHKEVKYYHKLIKKQY